MHTPEAETPGGRGGGSGVVGFRAIASNVLPPILARAIRATLRRYRRWRMSVHQRSRPIGPWTRFYQARKREFLIATINDDHLIESFRRGDDLPLSFGIAIDERCIEYPWVLSHLPEEPARILDVGSTLNHDFILDLSIFNNKNLHILTLAPEDECFWHRGISYLFHDARSMPYRDSMFDVVTCISTLEHIGFDNTYFTGDPRHREYDPRDFVRVMAEMARVLKPGGRLLFTVPYGVEQHFGSLRQFSAASLGEAIDAFDSKADTVKEFYRYSRAGWQISSQEGCADTEFVGWVAEGLHAEAADSLPVEEDLAAAARGVACVTLVKPRGS